MNLNFFLAQRILLRCCCAFFTVGRGNASNVRTARPQSQTPPNCRKDHWRNHLIHHQSMQINLHPGEVTQTMDFGQNYLNVHQDNPRAALAPCSKSDVSCDKHLSILYPQLCQKSIVGANPPQNSPTTATRQGPLRHVVTK